MTDLPPPPPPDGAKPPPPPGSFPSSPTRGQPLGRRPVVAIGVCVLVAGVMAVLLTTGGNDETSGTASPPSPATTPDEEPTTTTATSEPTQGSPAPTSNARNHTPATTLPSQAPLDTKPVQRSIQQLAKDVTKLQLGNGCPIRRFGDVVDTAAGYAGYEPFRSGRHLPAQHAIDPGGGVPVLECSIVSVPKPANGALPTLPEDPSVLPTITINITAAGIPADRRPASEPGFEHRGSNRGGDVYLVTDRSIEGVATTWIDDNVSIVLQLTGPRAKAIAPDDLDAAIAVPLQTLVDDASAL